MKDEITTIKVRVSTRDLLKSLGRKGETYDEIIRRLIHEAKKEDSNVDSGRLHCEME